MQDHNRLRLIGMVVLTIFLIWSGVLAVGADGDDFAGGMGTEGDPYEIETAAQLHKVRYDLGAHYKLVDDIDLSGYRAGEGWEPIGGTTWSFSGSFDGNGHTITGLTIHRTEDYQGLFGVVGYNGFIENMTLVGVSIIAEAGYVGGLAGDNRGSIRNSSVTGTKVEGENRVGGIAGGSFDGNIQNSFAEIDVAGNESIGGLVGSLSAAEVNNSYAMGNVSGNTRVGGLVGTITRSIITDSFAVSAVAGNTDTGGLVGLDNGATYGSSPSIVNDSFWNSTVYPTDNGIGTPMSETQFRIGVAIDNWGPTAAWYQYSDMDMEYPAHVWTNPVTLEVTIGQQDLTIGDETTITATAQHEDGTNVTDLITHEVNAEDADMITVVTQEGHPANVIKVTAKKGGKAEIYFSIYGEEKTIVINIKPDKPQDLAAPEIVNTDTVVITGTAQAGAEVKIIGESETVSGTAAADTGEFAIDVPLHQNTKNTFSVITITDALASDPVAIVVQHDNVKPEEPVIIIDTGAWTNAEQVNVELTQAAKDAGLSAIQTVHIKVGDGAWKEYGYVEEASIGFAVVEEGKTAIQAYAEDGVGNRSSTAAATVKLDRAAPNLTLHGDNPLHLLYGDSYDEPGATAVDDFTIDLAVTVTGNVYTDEIGKYERVYTVQDLAGNEATKTRTVYVNDLDHPVIELKGDNPLTLEGFTTYEEPGATAKDNYDGNLTEAIQITGEVDPTNLGTYKIYYNVSDSSGNEAFEVVREVYIVDRTAPTLTLNGKAVIQLELGTTYDDQGATATDNVDGDLNKTIKITGDVDTHRLGTYDIRYTATDHSGNQSSLIRTVEVVDTTAPAAVDLAVTAATMNSVTLAFSANDLAGMKEYIILRDGKQVTSIAGSLTTYTDHDLQPASKYTYTVIAVDPSGNQSASVSQDIITLSELTGVHVIADLKVPYGTALRDVPMPTEVSVTISHDKQMNVPVIWNEGMPAYDQHKVGTTVFRGELTLPEDVLNPSGLSATVQVTVTSPSRDDRETPDREESDDNESSGIEPPDVEESVSANLSSEIYVNGKKVNVGKALPVQMNGQTGTVITVGGEKLANRLAEVGEEALITISVQTDEDFVIGEFNGQLVKEMEEKEAVIELSTGNATYTLPVRQINITALSEALSEHLGGPVALKDIQVRIEIASPTEEMMKIVDNAVAKEDFSIVAPPHTFTVKGTYEDKTIEVSKFDAYVERTMAIPEDIDSDQVTTAVEVGADGTTRHVPTKIVFIDEMVHAKISSITNSTYALVWNRADFRDVAQHWAKDAVNDMGSRMVIQGTGNGLFNPDANITRAEFVAVLVRGLGLELVSKESSFTDVEQTTWYDEAIQTGISYNLISGFADGTFRPHDKVTREQAMVMIARAMKMTRIDQELSAQEINQLLSPYTDANNVSKWAEDGVANSLQAGIFSGKSSTELDPETFITRAEVAVSVRKLLDHSGLIEI